MSNSWRWEGWRGKHGKHRNSEGRDAKDAYSTNAEVKRRMHVLDSDGWRWKSVAAKMRTWLLGKTRKRQNSSDDEPFMVEDRYRELEGDICYSRYMGTLKGFFAHRTINYVKFWASAISHLSTILQLSLASRQQEKSSLPWGTRCMRRNHLVKKTMVPGKAGNTFHCDSAMRVLSIHAVFMHVPQCILCTLRYFWHLWCSRVTTEKQSPRKKPIPKEKQ